MRFKLPLVLGKALESARSVLDDLDADQVPASLRRVAAHAGELTPPLADRLAREIDRLDWLRERALDAWPDADHAGDGPDRASALFLARPEGWAGELARIAWEAGVASGSGASERDDRAARSLEGDLAAARDKVRSLHKEIETLRSELAAERRAARSPGRARRAAEAKAAEAAQKADEDRARAVAEGDAKVAALEADLGRLREEMRVVKRDRAEIVARLDELVAGGAWMGRGPLDLARHLDELMAQARRRLPGSAAGTEGVAGLALPAGVRPDTAEAIDTLVRLTPVGVVVDGYNVGLAMGEGAPAEVRSRLEDLLRRLDTLGGPSMTMTVVWDSAFDEPTPRRPDGLDVRFAPPGTPADDIVVAIAAASTRCVVITNDREVRERAEAEGALALWSDALVAWARRR